ncbi:hypothetical protein A5881_003616 [Enterococcus termitis]
MYSVFLSGNTYVPLESNMSLEKMSYILSDSTCEVLISNKKEINRIKSEIASTIKLIDIEDLIKENLENSIIEKDLTGPETKLDDTAYLIYTSGSTGTPKGVQISFKNVLNLFYHTKEYFNYLENQKTIIMNALCFDLSIWETIIALTSNTTIYLISDDIRLDQRKLIDFIKKNSISYLVITPSYCSALINTADLFSIDLSNTLSMLFLGAEKLAPKLVERAYKHFGNSTIIYNGYGPTEVTVCSFVKQIHPDEVGFYKKIGNVPIGEPFQGLQATIINENGEISKIGTLFLKGDGVSNLGYLGLPDQTEKVFSCVDGLDEYNTGDIVEIVGDEYYFLKRNDSQVKIRGYRVELDEIRNVLLNYPNVNDCLVIYKEYTNPSKQLLLTFYSSKNNETIEENQLRAWCSRYLNSYMVPNSYLRINEIPRNQNGKADTKELVKLFETTNTAETLKNNPDNDTSKHNQIYTSVLGKSNLDLSKSFFELGGHSLAAFQLQNEILSQLSKKISIKDIFESSSLNELSSLVNKLPSKA